ncbi:CHAP domain-containing protein [Mycolicibacter algericus]|uniref:CHAP domain-containing protein n=1 Tax=Mycolicibacter algericus DSM 45454 TaxID=723879 RepID=A0ABX3RMJ1_MYCAL|nr:CHAP domain-containing protein [Mycolicibacter algericus]OQZ95350.1 CHAP domain-containing protein [Mycolicibacter algericus DSM 45454]
MANKIGVVGCAVAAIAAFGLGPVPAAYAPSRADPVIDHSPVHAGDAGPGPAEALPAKVNDALDVFRGAAADAALGHPVMYGDGQCYPLILQYIRALGYPWRNRDPSGNAFDLYEHFPTNGLGEFFDQVPSSRLDGGTNLPQVGDIVVYGPGGYVSEHGHAAVVTAVRGNGPLFGYETADQNSGGRLFVTLNWRDLSPMWNTLGYLRPRV